MGSWLLVMCWGCVLGCSALAVAHRIGCSRAVRALRCLQAVTRIEIVNAFSNLFAALLVALARDTLDPSFAGAALNFALSSGGIIGFSIILATDLEVC